MPGPNKNPLASKKSDITKRKEFSASAPSAVKSSDEQQEHLNDKVEIPESYGLRGEDSNIGKSSNPLNEKNEAKKLQAEKQSKLDALTEKLGIGVGTVKGLLSKFSGGNKVDSQTIPNKQDLKGNNIRKK